MNKVFYFNNKKDPRKVKKNFQNIFDEKLISF